jgi:2-oxoglutarate dehydrogenase E2 component (dihydrolipoamide succinyltransferase)
MSKLVDIILSEGQLEGTAATMAAWLVTVGDKVAKGDPLAELETDKVVMEVCADAGGVIKSLHAKAGDEIAIEQVLGQIEVVSSEDNVEAEVVRVIEEDNGAREFISPAVRRLINENELTIDNIIGTGKRGRVTRDDIQRYLINPQAQAVNREKIIVEKVAPESSFSVVSDKKSRPLKGTMVPHSKMRKSIASHMVESLLNTSPHVTSVFEMDMSNIIEHRKWHKKEFTEQGTKLTFTAYFLSAMVQAVSKVPQSNARFHEDALEVFTDVNIGIGTALGDAGLVVPVIEQVQKMNLFEIAQNLNKQTEKARSGKLTLADMRNGTITISNHGVSGSLFAAPIIINQPQVAILGIGKLEKRVVVEQVKGEDTMVIRPKCYVSLSIDHRALDAHQTNLYLSEFVNIIESWGM